MYSTTPTLVLYAGNYSDTDGSGVIFRTFVQIGLTWDLLDRIDMLQSAFCTINDLVPSVLSLSSLITPKDLLRVWQLETPSMNTRLSTLTRHYRAEDVILAHHALTNDGDAVPHSLPWFVLRAGAEPVVPNTIKQQLIQHNSGFLYVDRANISVCVRDPELGDDSLYPLGNVNVAQLKNAMRLLETSNDQ